MYNDYISIFHHRETCSL